MPRAYEEGKLAYVAGVGIGSNPYINVERPGRTRKEYDQWHAGWVEMERDQQKAA